MADERPAKRQKLGGDLEHSQISGYPDHVPLIRRSFPVTFIDTNDYRGLLKSAPDQEVQLTTLESSTNATLLHVRVPLLKKIVDLSIQIPETDHTLILSCANLPSTARKTKKGLDQYPAICRAILKVHDSYPVLDLQLLWRDSVYPREKVDRSLRQILRDLCRDENKPVEDQARTVAWDVKEFYDNVHVPTSGNTTPLKLDQMQCKLYPFQDRATRWMLGREGVEARSSGQIVSLPTSSKGLPLDFKEIETHEGPSWFVSEALRVITRSKEDVLSQYKPFKGGVLAEAMGLGKTVEMIALMCSHTRDQSPLIVRNSHHLRETGATLIITPPTILEQWKQEIKEHAPSLSVFHYTGVKSYAKRKDDIVDVLVNQDVVLTTYSVIASEIHYVQERPDRSLRKRERREPPKSPLTQILWWRCLLDEAQMVETGVSNAAIVARLIPRVNAWAVTGTPLKQSHRDLYGLLLFLRYEPWCHSASIWDRLVYDHRDLFRQLIGSVTLRHSKEQVREELRIPTQSRKIVNIPFTAIEESHYAQMHYDMQQDCGFDSAGGPLDKEWDPNNSVTVEKMRNWLQRLRQTCLHPEVGGRNRKALGKRGGGPLRTVAQVLDVMIEQTDSSVHTEQRNMLMARTDQARIFEHARESLIAQEMFQRAYEEATIIVENCRKQLVKELEKSRLAKKEVPNGLEATASDDEEGEDADSSLTTARQRLRGALEVQHICIFFIGNTHYQMKSLEELKLSAAEEVAEQVGDSIADTKVSSEALDTKGQSKHAEAAPGTQAPSEKDVKARITELEKLEAAAYEEAKKIRTELLTEAHRKAIKRINNIRAKRDSQSFVNIALLENPDEDFGGVEVRKVFEKLYHYCKAMNAQAQQFGDIRAKMTDMLCKVLIDEEEGVELTGEEYEDSTKHQDEMYVMMEMLRALFADRSDAISGQENLLLKHETKQMLKDAKAGEGPAPELMIRLMSERERARIIPSQQGSLRGILNEIRSLVSSLEWQKSSSERARVELILVQRVLQHVQKLQATQAKSINALEQEVGSFRDAMNARLDYYRALQVISDMVAPIGEDDDVGKPADQAWVSRLHDAEEAATKKLSVAASKRRYLLNLKNEQESGGEAKICTICQFEFEIGTLTVCGHQFCKECIQMWWSEHRNCPVCKRRLQLTDFYDVTYKPTETAPESPTSSEEETQAAPSDKPATSQPNTIYTTISANTLSQIHSIDLRGSSYGSKVDTTVRHILHLRRTDPGSKSIIFSQYRDFLNVLSKCLRANDIIHSKFDDKDGITHFKSDPANECFLLHAKAHSAGLNLVCASHVVLCEPLINTAIELQAVARVHRIGQTRETCVWMYIVEGTVEEAIYDISVRRRLAHMDSKSRNGSTAASRAGTPCPHLNKGEIAIEAANAKELQAADISKMFAAGKTGGEIVDKEDLWECLFGNAEKRKGMGMGTDTGGPSRGLGDLPAASAHGPGVGLLGATSEIARHLRGEAAEGRRAG